MFYRSSYQYACVNFLLRSLLNIIQKATRGILVK